MALLIVQTTRRAVMLKLQLLEWHKSQARTGNKSIKLPTNLSTNMDIHKVRGQ